MNLIGDILYGFIAKFGLCTAEKYELNLLHAKPRHIIEIADPITCSILLQRSRGSYAVSAKASRIEIKETLTDR